jgi:hypothetical protein
MMNVEGKIIMMETKRNMVVEYLNEYKKYNEEYNTNTMDDYIEKCEELIVKYDLMLSELKSYKKGVDELC